MPNIVSDRNQKAGKPVKELLSLIMSYVPLGGLAWFVLGNISAPNESMPLVVIIIVACAAIAFALVVSAAYKTYAMPEDRTSSDYSAWETSIRDILWFSNMVYATSLACAAYCATHSIISILRKDSSSFYYLLALLCVLIAFLGAAVCKAIVERGLADADKRALESCESSISKLTGTVRNEVTLQLLHAFHFVTTRRLERFAQFSFSTLPTRVSAGCSRVGIPYRQKVLLTIQSRRPMRPLLQRWSRRLGLAEL